MARGSHGASSADKRTRAAERELREFSYIISHDLSAPLRHIKSFSELLLQDNAAYYNAEQIAYVEHIRAAATRGAEMVEQVLVYSHVQQNPLELEECDVMLLLDVVRLQLSEEIRKSGAQITVDAIPFVRADHKLLTLALRHILDNAIKFRSEGHAPIIDIAPVDDSRNWRLRISDDGVGLPAMDPERLFNMFCRGRAEGSFPGIGAGLTIARRILRRHGGDVVFARANAGTCVDLTLPRRAAARSQV